MAEAAAFFAGETTVALDEAAAALDADSGWGAIRQVFGLSDEEADLLGVDARGGAGSGPGAGGRLSARRWADDAADGLAGCSALWARGDAVRRRCLVALAWRRRWTARDAAMTTAWQADPCDRALRRLRGLGAL